MLLRLLCLTVLAAPAALTQTATPSAARPDIIAMLEATGSLAALDRIFTPEAMEAQMRNMLKPEGAPPAQRAKMGRFVKEFAQEFSAEVKQHRQQLLDLTVAIYARHYTTGDVEAIVAFYQTPTGRKMSNLNGQLITETMQAAQAWGQQLGERVGRRVGERLEAGEKEQK